MNSRLASLVAICLLLLLVVVVYHSATKNSFHLDDWTSIEVNPAIQMEELSLQNLRFAWRMGFLPTRRLANVTFAIDWWRGGGSAAAFQATNVGIHAASATAVFLLILCAFRPRTDEDRFRAALAAFFGSALWAAHPIQVQGVTYIVQRMASLSTLFTVLAVVAYVRGRRSGRIAWYVSSLVAFLLGVLVKETAWIVPALLLLAEFGICRNETGLVRRRLDFVLLALPVAGALFVGLDVLSGAGPVSERFLGGYEQRDFTLSQRVLTQPRVIGFHFSQIVWPLPARFSIEHDFLLSTGLWRPWSTLPAWAAAAGWCALGSWLVLRKGRRVYGFAMLWVPATLAIESTFIPLEMIFEHRMYLATVGLAVLAGLATEALLKGDRVRRTAVVGANLLLVVLFGASTMARLPVWRTERTLYEHAALHAPGKARVWSKLGRLQLRAGEKQLAEASTRRALELDADDAVALEDLGVILLDQGRPQEALALLERARAVDIPDVSLLNHVGEAYLQLGRNEEAAQAFGTALSLAPSAANPRWNLALALERQGNCAEARKNWERYLDVEALETERARVHEHLVEHYDTPGGRCAEGADRERKEPEPSH